MLTVLIIIHLMIVLALIVVVLLQRSEGGLGLGGGGGTSGFMTGRGQANALTKATAVLAALFFAMSLGLTWIANQGRAPRSVLDNAAPAAPGTAAPAPEGQGPGILEELQRRQSQPAAPSAPQVPQSR
jgi:preprotein translocase subunit SecG